MLNEMDGIEGRKNVIVMGATNRPDIIDKAVLRPGRLDKLVYVPPPDWEGRREILKITTAKMPLEASVDLDKLANATELFSGAETALVSREAAMLAIKRNSLEVSQADLETAAEAVKPQLNRLELSRFEQFNKK